MTALLWTLIVAQIVMGGLDTILHHEMTERLAWRESQKTELRLHAVRNLFYVVILGGLATWQPSGWIAGALAVLLVGEFAITLRDFAEEDLTRKLPMTERLLHTVLTANYGGVLVLLVPVLIGWASDPTALRPVWYGGLSVICLGGALAVGVLAVRDWLAANRFARLHTRPLAELTARSAAPKTVLVTGGTGFIGHRLVPALQQAGHRVILLARGGNTRDVPPPFTVVTTLDEIANDTPIDAVINLAGAPIMAGLWTAKAKARMRNSRIGTTHAIAALIERLDTRPSALVQGSAIGVYGVSPGAVDEHSWIEVDGSFSQRLCLDWEAEAARIDDIRTVTVRIGVVLDRAGAALGQMLVPTEYAGGTRLGDGTQRMSWISRDDCVRVILHGLETESLHGPINAVTGVISNTDFTKALATALHRPSVLVAPKWLLARLAMGREILLADQAVTRRVGLLRMLDPELEPFLNANLGRRVRAHKEELRHAATV